jgi:hypothetical protein
MITSEHDEARTPGPGAENETANLMGLPKVHVPRAARNLMSPPTKPYLEQRKLYLEHLQSTLPSRAAVANERYRQAAEHIEVDHRVLQAIWNLHQPDAREPRFCAACLLALPCPTIRCFEKVL